jgi:ElaB/YqjD/DUF883 family membrane-anchored ribosome-binding protein
MKSELSNIERDFSRLHKKAEEYTTKKGDKKVDEFLLLYKELKIQTKKIDDEIKPSIQVFLMYIQHFEKWFEIARSYQTAFEKAISVEQNLGNSEPKKQFEIAAKNLQEFLDEKKEEGLKASERKEIEIKQIIEQTDKYIRDYRIAFNEQKSFIFDQLKNVSNQPSQIRTTFEEDDVKGSYERLSNECLELFNNALNDIRRSYNEINIDVAYSKKILELDKEIEKMNIEDGVKKSVLKLESIKKDLKQEIFIDISKRNLLTEIATSLSKERETYQKSNGILREIQSPGYVGKNAKVLLDLIADGQIKNLKDIILDLTKSEDIDLDNALDILKECFKSRRIDILVKRKS